MLVTKGFLRITPGLHDIGLSRAHIIRAQGSMFRHDYILLIARMRRTGVRPTFNRRAISDLLLPARCSFRIAGAWSPAVIGRPSRFPFSRA